MLLKRLHHLTVQLLGNPAALRQAGLNPIDAAVALPWVVVAVSTTTPGRQCRCRREQIARQIRNIFLRDRYNNEFPEFGEKNARS
jgi:hypothetical protein